MKVVLFISIVLCCISRSEAFSIYVNSVNGNDNNDGSITSPLATLPTGIQTQQYTTQNQNTVHNTKHNNTPRNH